MNNSSCFRVLNYDFYIFFFRPPVVEEKCTASTSGTLNVENTSQNDKENTESKIAKDSSSSAFDKEEVFAEFVSFTFILIYFISRFAIRGVNPYLNHFLCNFPFHMFQMARSLMKCYLQVCRSIDYYYYQQ